MSSLFIVTYINQMVLMCIKMWYIGAAVIAATLFGIYRLGPLKGLAIVFPGVLLLLNCYYYFMFHQPTSDFGMLTSLFLGAFGLLLFVYGLFFSEPSQ